MDRAREYMISLTRKRGQLRRATTTLVHKAFEWLDQVIMVKLGHVQAS